MLENIIAIGLTTFLTVSFVFLVIMFLAYLTVREVRGGQQAQVSASSQVVVLGGFYGKKGYFPLIAFVAMFLIACVMPIYFYPLAIIVTVPNTLLLLVLGINIVPQQEAWIIELLGKYYVTWEAGVHVLVPGFMRIRKQWYLADQSLSLMMTKDPDPRDGRIRGTVETKDDSVGINAIAVIRVFDPIKATYEVADLKPALLGLLDHSTREKSGGMTTDELIASKKGVADNILAIHAQKALEWGVRLCEYLLADIDLSTETTETRRARITAESNRQVAVTTAHGQAEALTINAEARKKADTLLGEGQGAQIRQAAEIAGLTPEQIAGLNLAKDQATALSTATVVLNSGNGQNPFNIPAATVEVEKILGTLRGGKEDKQK